MTRWKALPDELDPQVREFASRLRRLVDRGGLSVAALADRTGYSRTSWDRYLNGRLLAPKGAVVALAEVTGTDPAHLVTMWELAERAWSRSELRHDRTMEAIRVSRARAALPGPAPAPGASHATQSPPSPAQAEPRDAAAPGDAGGPPPAAPPAGGGDRARGRRRAVMFLAGLAGALVLIGAVFHVTGGNGGGKAAGAAKSPSPSVSTPQKLPPGVKCAGASCTGKDAESMGCSGDLVTTARSVTVGTALLEVRYSRTCGAAWGRITRAAQGDEVRVVAGGRQETGTITAAGDTIAYTPMIAVGDADRAKACATLASGRQGCTR
ncbi:helix-turn-helix domain-containing protein [Streptomyces anandii]|uniref:Helix-turn-helix domain-containing protein n=1 Tax=Streptomyces anandii TaxID=285454 RepID=A0ABW6HG44_9ACTN